MHRWLSPGRKEKEDRNHCRGSVSSRMSLSQAAQELLPRLCFTRPAFHRGVGWGGADGDVLPSSRLPPSAFCEDCSWSGRVQPSGQLQPSPPRFVIFLFWSGSRFGTSTSPCTGDRITANAACTRLRLLLSYLMLCLASIDRPPHRAANGLPWAAAIKQARDPVSTCIRATVFVC